MEIIYTQQAKEDMLFLKKSGDKSALKKIESLIDDLMKNPFSGLGKPERLKHKDGKVYSRKIDKKNRLVYEVLQEANLIYVYRLKGHYEE